jgi:hypothetical protein
MRRLVWGVLLIAFAAVGCAKQQPPEEVIAKVNDYEISVSEFEEGFASSAYASREDKLQARREYLGSLIDRKLILQDAQKKNIDKDKDFLKSIERFWEQSLLTVALGLKTQELSKSVRVREEDTRRIYDGMVKDGITTKAYEDVYPQIKWQAQKQIEGQKLGDWIEGLKKGASIKIDEDLLKRLK